MPSPRQSTSRVPSKKGTWTEAEDKALQEAIRERGGPFEWVQISAAMHNLRTPKQCRERYHQNLKPSIDHRPITEEEGRLIIEMVERHGRRWAEIARTLPNRTDNSVKNWWCGRQNKLKMVEKKTEAMRRAERDQHAVGAQSSRGSARIRLPDVPTVDIRDIPGQMPLPTPGYSRPHEQSVSVPRYSRHQEHDHQHQPHRFQRSLQEIQEMQDANRFRYGAAPHQQYNSDSVARQSSEHNNWSWSHRPASRDSVPGLAHEIESVCTDEARSPARLPSIHSLAPSPIISQGSRRNSYHESLPPMSPVPKPEWQETSDGYNHRVPAWQEKSRDGQAPSQGLPPMPRGASIPKRCSIASLMN